MAISVYQWLAMVTIILGLILTVLVGVIPIIVY